MRQSTQGGSLRKFIVIAVIVAGLIAGGVYLLRLQTPQSEPIISEEPAVVEEPAPEEVKEETAEPVHELPGQAVTPQLPATGPTESLGALLVVGLVSIIVVYYARSRRPELSL